MKQNFGGCSIGMGQRPKHARYYSYFFIFRFARFASLLTLGFFALIFLDDDPPEPPEVPPFVLALTLSLLLPSTPNFKLSFVIAALTCFFANLLAILSAFAAFSFFLSSFDRCSRY